MFRGRTLKRGGTLTWQGKEYGLRPACMFRERYALAEGETELATIEGKGWGKRPVKVAVGARPTLDPGLLLFARVRGPGPGRGRGVLGRRRRQRRGHRLTLAARLSPAARSAAT